MAMLGVDYRIPTETIAATTAATIQHDENLPSGPLAWLLFVVTGANNGLAGTGTTSYSASLDGDEWLNIQGAELRCLFEFVYSRLGGAAPAAADLEWGFPIELLWILAPQLNNGSAPIVGLPGNTEKEVRHVVNASSSAGTSQIGWKRSLTAPTHAPYIVGKTISGLTASTTDNVLQLNLQPFPTAGLIMTNAATDFTRTRIYLADQNGRVDEISDFRINHTQMMHQPFSAVSITSPIYIPFDVPLIFRKGSYLLLDTGAGYDGTERIVPVQFIPLTAPGPAGEQSAQ